MEVSKIGRQIAEEVLDLQRRGEDSSSGSSPGPATETGLLNTEVNIFEFKGKNKGRKQANEQFINIKLFYIDKLSFFFACLYGFSLFFYHLKF